MYFEVMIYLDRRSLNKWVQKKIKILTLFFSILILVHKNQIYVKSRLFSRPVSRGLTYNYVPTDLQHKMSKIVINYVHFIQFSRFFFKKSIFLKTKQNCGWLVGWLVGRFSFVVLFVWSFVFVCLIGCLVGLLIFFLHLLLFVCICVHLCAFVCICLHLFCLLLFVWFLFVLFVCFVYCDFN